MKKFKLGKGKVVIGTSNNNSIPTITLRNSKLKEEIGSDSRDKSKPEVVIEVTSLESLNVLSRSVDRLKSYFKYEEDLLDLYLDYHILMKVFK